MDNPLSSKLNADSLLPKIVADIKACISDMKQEFEETDSSPLTDDSSLLNKFCAKLELLLQFGIRERTGIFGGTKNYWNYILECLSNNKNLKDGLRFVKSRSELKTNAGRGRALIRFSLVHHRLADTLQYCLMNAKLNSEWYTAKSLFHQKKLAGDLLMALYDLNELQFDLDPRDSELDLTWPTFARKPAGFIYNWRPPSRTGSIASLSSIPNIEIYPSSSLSMTPNIEEGDAFATDKMSFDSSEMLRESSTSEEEVERLRQLVKDMTAKYDDAFKRVQELEAELNAKESYIKENEIGTRVVINGVQLNEKPPSCLKADDEAGNQLLEEKVMKESHQDGKVGVAADGVVSSFSQSSVEVSLKAHGSSECQTLVSGENKDDAYQSTIASLQQQLMAAVNAREHLSEEMTAATSEIERLTNVEAEVRLLQHEKSQLAEKVELLNTELREAKEEKYHVGLRSKEESFFEKAFEDAMKDKTSAEAALEELKPEYSRLLTQFETSENSIQELEKRLECILVENQNLTDRVSELEKVKEEQKVGFSRLQLKAAATEMRIDELEMELAVAHSNLDESERKLQDMSDQISKEKYENLRILDEKEKTCEMLQMKNSEMNEEFTKSAEKNEESSKLVSQLKNKISELDEHLESVRRSLEESNSKAVLLEDTSRETQAELEEVLKVKDALESEKTALAEELRQRSEDLDRKSSECEQLLEKLREMEEKLESQENSMKILLAEKEKIVADLQEDLDALAGSVQRREKMWENARESMEQDISEKANRIQVLEQTVADGFTKQRVIELEKKAEESEDALGAVRLEMEIDQDRARVQLDDLKQCLGHLEHDKFLLQEQLNEKDELMKKERASFLQSQQNWEQESKLMNDDIKALKKRVIKLVKEKADLWQKTDDLTYEQKLKASYQWMNSTEVTNCLICHVPFSVTVRKHHCRKCGRVLCNNCCNNWALTPHSNLKERICNECHVGVSQLETTVNSPAEDESDTESISKKPTSVDNREPTSVKEPVSADIRERAADDGYNVGSSDTEDSVLSERRECTENADSKKPVQHWQTHDSPFEAGLAEEILTVDNSENRKEEENFGSTENDEEFLGKVEVPGELDETIRTAGDEDPATGDMISGTSSAWSLSGSAKAAVSWVSSAASVTTSLASVLIPKQLKSSPKENSSFETATEDLPGNDLEHSASLQGTEADRPNELTTTEKRDTNSDLFDVISPEEISESRLCPSQDPNILCGTVVKLCDAEIEGVMTVSENELSIKAGKCFAIPVSIEAVGLKLSWQFSTRPKGISFAVLYRESDAVPCDECVSLIPLTRLNSHHQTVTGELKAKKLGVYTLLFDNLASRFTSKKLKYKLQAEMAEVASQDTDDIESETSRSSDTCNETTEVAN